MTIYRVPERIKAFLFDIDGTLYTHAEYGRFQTEVMIRKLAAMRGEAYETTATAVERIRTDYAATNGGASTSLGNTLAALGVDIATSVAWRRRLLDPFRFLSIDARLRDALAALSRDSLEGAVLIAVTNNPRSVGEATLEALGVRDLFCRIVGLDDTMRSKPAPEPYILAAAVAGCAREACISVGDRYDVDLAIPLELGMGAVLVGGVVDVYELPRALTGH